MSAGHHENLLMLDAIAAKSGLRMVSPGLKTGFAVICLLLCVGAGDVVVGAAVACSMAGILWRLGKVSLRRILGLIKVPAAFLVVSCVVILVEFTPAPMGFWQIPITHSRWLCLTEESLNHAAAVFFQALGAVFCLYFLSATTPMPQLIDVLRRCHLPEIMIELMYLIYRYLFVLLDVQQKMTIAAGARLGYHGVRASVRTAGLISGGVLGSSFRRCGTNLDAMEARGYTGELRFLSHTPGFRLRHGLFALGYLTLLGLLILVRKGNAL